MLQNRHLQWTHYPISVALDSEHRGDRGALGGAAVSLRVVRAIHATDRSGPVTSSQLRGIFGQPLSFLGKPYFLGKATEG
jgi:hypothetical protein